MGWTRFRTRSFFGFPIETMLGREKAKEAMQELIESPFSEGFTKEEKKLFDKMEKIIDNTEKPNIPEPNESSSDEEYDAYNNAYKNSERSFTQCRL